MAKPRKRGDKWEVRWFDANGEMHHEIHYGDACDLTRVIHDDEAWSQSGTHWFNGISSMALVQWH